MIRFLSEERISKKSIEESQNLIAKRSKKVKKQYFQFSSIPPQFRKKKKIEDCRGDCCQSKVIPDKGYTTRSITSKKIAITTGLLSIDREDPSIVKAWIGYPDAVWADILWTVSSSSAVKPADYRPLDPFTPVIHYPIRGTPDNGGRSRCDHARRNRWTRETTTPPPLLESISRWEDKGWRRRGIVGKGIDLGAIHSHGC